MPGARPPFGKPSGIKYMSLHIIVLLIIFSQCNAGKVSASGALVRLSEHWESDLAEFRRCKGSESMRHKVNQGDTTRAANKPHEKPNV